MKAIVLKLIRGYQKTAPHRHVMFGSIIPVYSACRYSPTCSDYTYQAVKKYGATKGLFLGIMRILSCNPLGGHGFRPLA